jgi:hypothetical protein
MLFTITTDDGKWTSSFLSSSASKQAYANLLFFSLFIVREGKLTSLFFLFEAGIMNQSNQEAL